MKIVRKKRPESVCQIEKNANGVTYITFPGIEKTGVVKHMCSTRLGGVSTGIYQSMNVSFARGDDKQAVYKNFSKIADCMGESVDKIVCTDQTHTTNILEVHQQDAGMGITQERSFSDIDGLVTHDKGIIIAAFFADCVPLLFVDPQKKAIGIAHSGWRGTVNQIGKNMVATMKKLYNSNPEDLHAAIGPSICKDCYEVSEEVIGQIKEKFDEKFWNLFFTPNGKEGKYQLDLWEMNRQILIQSGVPVEQIEVTDICTCCNPSLLFSHRASQGKRGNLGVFMKLLAE